MKDLGAEMLRAKMSHSKPKCYGFPDSPRLSQDQKKLFRARVKFDSQSVNRAEAKAYNDRMARLIR